MEFSRLQNHRINQLIESKVADLQKYVITDSDRVAYKEIRQTLEKIARELTTRTLDQDKLLEAVQNILDKEIEKQKRVTDSGDYRDISSQINAAICQNPSQQLKDKHIKQIVDVLNQIRMSEAEKDDMDREGVIHRFKSEIKDGLVDIHESNYIIATLRGAIRKLRRWEIRPVQDVVYDVGYNQALNDVMALTKELYNGNNIGFLYQSKSCLACKKPLGLVVDEGLPRFVKKGVIHQSCFVQSKSDNV